MVAITHSGRPRADAVTRSALFGALVNGVDGVVGVVGRVEVGAVEPVEGESDGLGAVVELEPDPEEPAPPPEDPFDPLPEPPAAELLEGPPGGVLPLFGGGTEHLRFDELAVTQASSVLGRWTAASKAPLEFVAYLPRPRACGYSVTVTAWLMSYPLPTRTGCWVEVLIHDSEHGEVGG